MSRIPKRPVGYKLGSKTPDVVIEMWIDYLCPFSKKGYNRMKEVLHHYNDNLKKNLGLSAIVYLQPWHPQTYYLAQAAEAVAQLGGVESFWKMTDALYAAQDSFSDDKVANKSKVQMYEELAKIAQDAAGIEREKFLQALDNDQTQLAIKINQKYGRQNSVHSTPTFAINGLVDSNISSGWTLEQWQELLDPLFK